MAIRERKGRASPWQCYWNNPLTGKRECANFSTRLEAEKHDSLIKHRLKFDRESFRKEEERTKETREMTLEQVYFLYLKEKQFNKKGLSWQMDAMRLPLMELGMLPVKMIEQSHIRSVMEKMNTANVKSVTVRARMSVLRTVLRWAASMGWRESVAFPKLPAAHYERLVPPTAEELSNLLLVAPPHIARVIILGAKCGVRVGPSELFRLTWADVDFDQQAIIVHGAKKNLASPWREVPIQDALMPLFVQWYNEDRARGLEYLIHFHGKPVKKIQTAWEITLRRAGISRRIRPYDLRHAFATNLIAGGVDIGTVAKLMGHSTPTMVLTHYQYVMDSQKRAAVNALPELRYVPKAMCPKAKPSRALP